MSDFKNPQPHVEIVILAEIYVFFLKMLSRTRMLQDAHVSRQIGELFWPLFRNQRPQKPRLTFFDHDSSLNSRCVPEDAISARPFMPPGMPGNFFYLVFVISDQKNPPAHLSIAICVKKCSYSWGWCHLEDDVHVPRWVWELLWPLIRDQRSWKPSRPLFSSRARVFSRDSCKCFYGQDAFTSRCIEEDFWVHIWIQRTKKPSGAPSFYRFLVFFWKCDFRCDFQTRYG